MEPCEYRDTITGTQRLALCWQLLSLLLPPPLRPTAKKAPDRAEVTEPAVTPPLIAETRRVRNPDLHTPAANGLALGSESRSGCLLPAETLASRRDLRFVECRRDRRDGPTASQLVFQHQSLPEDRCTAS